jgi:hypothetical protein
MFLELTPASTVIQLSLQPVDKPTDKASWHCFVRRPAPIRGPRRGDQPHSAWRNSCRGLDVSTSHPKIAMVRQTWTTCAVPSAAQEISTMADGLRVACSACGEYESQRRFLAQNSGRDVNQERGNVVDEARRSSHRVTATGLLASAVPKAAPNRPASNPPPASLPYIPATAITTCVSALLFVASLEDQGWSPSMIRSMPACAPTPRPTPRWSSSTWSRAGVGRSNQTPRKTRGASSGAGREQQRRGFFKLGCGA